MKLFKKSHDGGPRSGVTGYWLVEWKPVFSIVLLRFSAGSREAYHTHAFNALTWWIKGSVTEHLAGGLEKQWRPSIIPKYTPRNCFHKIVGNQVTWAISVRGPWQKTWFERTKGRTIMLTHGRTEV